MIVTTKRCQTPILVKCSLCPGWNIFSTASRSPRDGSTLGRCGLRAFVAGIYHLGSHGSDDRHLFLSDAERLLFVGRLGVILQRFELGLISYTLMSNHYHLIATLPDARVSKALQQLHGWYSRLHNRLHRRSAHLFRAHFFAREIESEADLLGTCRYVALNPVKAGLAPDPFAWRWSSVAATVGLAKAALPLELEPLRAAFGGTENWQARYRAFLECAPP